MEMLMLCSIILRERKIVEAGCRLKAWIALEMESLQQSMSSQLSSIMESQVGLSTLDTCK